MGSLSAVMLVSYLAPQVLHCTLPVSISKLLHKGKGARESRDKRVSVATP